MGICYLLCKDMKIFLYLNSCQSNKLPRGHSRISNDLDGQGLTNTTGEGWLVARYLMSNLNAHVKNYDGYLLKCIEYKFKELIYAKLKRDKYF